MTKLEFRTECQRRRDMGLVLTGNTYAIKDEIKNAGGIWDRDERAWLIPDEVTVARLHDLMGEPEPTVRPAWDPNWAANNPPRTRTRRGATPRSCWYCEQFGDRMAAELDSCDKCGADYDC